MPQETKPVDLWAGPDTTPDLTSRHVVLGPVTERRGRQLGSSDWAHVLDEPPYGCGRRLMYRKTGVEMSEPSNDYETNAMYRGKSMESVVVAEYVKHTGFRVEPVYEYDLPDSLPTWWRPHPDGKIIRNDGRGPGALEVKCPSIRGTWRQYRREGLPTSWIMQLQSEMGGLQTRWAAPAILPWGGTYELWTDQDGDVPEIRRDDEMIAHMVDLGEAFLRKFDKGELPAKQDPHECKACASCPWIGKCQGRQTAAEVSGAAGGHDELVLEADPALEALVAQYDEFREIKTQAEEQLEEIKARATAELKRRGAVAIRLGPGRRLIRRIDTKGSPGFDKKRLQTEKPGVFKEYVTAPKPNSYVRIFGARGGGNGD